MTEDLSLRALLMAIRYDLTAAQGKLTEAFRQVDALGLEQRKDPPTAFNQQAPYVPGKLRYLPGAKMSLELTGNLNEVRWWLEGFTDDEAEIQAHLDALKVPA